MPHFKSNFLATLIITPNFLAHHVLIKSTSANLQTSTTVIKMQSVLILIPRTRVNAKMVIKTSRQIVNCLAAFAV